MSYLLAICGLVLMYYIENVLVDFNLTDIPQMAVKEKDSNLKLKRFFGDKVHSFELVPFN